MQTYELSAGLYARRATPTGEERVRLEPGLCTPETEAQERIIRERLLPHGLAVEVETDDPEDD